MNIKLITKAQTHYEVLGFRYLDAPWTTDWDVSLETAPESATFYPVENKLLVASGEQSFIQLLKENKLPRGKFQTITPCFRDDKEDFLHKRYFIKLELINTGLVSERSLQEMVENAYCFFDSFVEIKIEKTEIGIDLVTKSGIELGSYGIRKTKYGSFIYGTGCAEPRLSQAISKENY